MFLLRSSHFVSLRTSIQPLQTLRRYAAERQPQYQAPNPTGGAAQNPNPHREFYRGGLGRAVAFNFLTAMATFQVIYWGWLKLESLEVKKEKGEEIERLQGEVGRLSGARKE